MRRFVVVVGLIPFLVAASADTAAAAGPSGSGDSRVTNGSPKTHFPRNKQNEPSVGVAIDPAHPTVLVSGANEEIDNAPCAGNKCGFTPGVGDNGVYFSFDSGRSWSQPTYTGWTARNGTPHVGPIGTVPWFYESGLVADGDPSLAFGPKPGPHGFSWDNGSRLYYASLTSNFPGQTVFDAAEAIAVSHTDNVAAAAHNYKSAWARPVIASHQLQPVTFSDKEQIWADNASSSSYFGNAYVCWTSFGATDSPIVLARSSDGGTTWSDPVTLTDTPLPTVFTGPTDCQVRTDSRGTVYAFWQEINLPALSHQVMARSFDGGVTFEAPRPVADVNQVGAQDPVHAANNDPRYTFDGIAGSRTWSGLSVDIANGAPRGADATDEIVMTWSDARNGLNHEQALVQASRDRGLHWSAPLAAQQGNDRPDFPAVAISPNGKDVYLTYDAFLAPWRSTTSTPRPMQGVVRHAAVDGGRLENFASLHRGAVGDARGSSENNLCCEFLGDYNYAAATRTYGSAVWNDVRNAAVCDVINDYRQSLISTAPLPKPSPLTQCPPRFGNSDIFGGSYAAPS